MDSDELVKLFFTKPTGNFRFTPETEIPYFDKDDFGFCQHMQVLFDRDHIAQKPMSTYYTYFFLGAILTSVNNGDLMHQLGVEEMYMKFDREDEMIKVVTKSKSKLEIHFYTVDVRGNGKSAEFTYQELQEVYDKLKIWRSSKDYFLTHTIYKVRRLRDGDRPPFALKLDDQYPSFIGGASRYTVFSEESKLESDFLTMKELRRSLMKISEHLVNHQKEMFINVKAFIKTKISEEHVKILTQKNANVVKEGMKPLFKLQFDLFHEANEIFKTTYRMGNEKFYLNALNEDACLGFIHGSLEGNFKKKFDLDFSTDALYLFVISRQNSLHQLRNTDIPVTSVRIAPLYRDARMDENAVYSTLIKIKGEGDVNLPVQVYSQAKSTPVAILNFRNQLSNFASTVSSISKYKGFVGTLLQECSDFIDNYKQKLTDSANGNENDQTSPMNVLPPEWQNKMYYKLEQRLTEDIYVSNLDFGGNEHFLSKFIMGQILSTEYYSQGNKLESYVHYNKWVKNEHENVVMTSLLLKSGRDNYAINLNIIEHTAFEDADYVNPTATRSIPSLDKLGIKHVLKIDIYAYMDIAQNLQERKFSWFDIDLHPITTTGLSNALGAFEKLNFLNINILFQSSEETGVKFEHLMNENKILKPLKSTTFTKTGMETVIKGMFVHKAEIIETNGQKFNNLITILPFDNAESLGHVPILLNLANARLNFDPVRDLHSGMTLLKQAILDQSDFIAQLKGKFKLVNMLISYEKTESAFLSIEESIHVITSALTTDQQSLGCIENLRKKRRAIKCESAWQHEIIENNDFAMKHLNKVQKFSHQGNFFMMTKNLFADILNGHFEGVAINLGFIASSFSLSKLSQKLVHDASALSKGSLVLKNLFKMSAPFMARATSAFIIYDLIRNAKELSSGNNDALVSVVGDSAYLAIDVTEITVSLAETFGLIEGLSETLGPLGAAIGLIIFIGTDVYYAVKKVQQIDNILRLQPHEKLREGIRAFFGVKPKNYIVNLIDEKTANTALYKNALTFLSQHNEFRAYIFPTGKVVRKCLDKVRRSWGPSSAPYAIDYVVDTTCDSHIQHDLNNEVFLDKVQNNVQKSRSTPDSLPNSKIVCLPKKHENEESSFHKTFYTDQSDGNPIYLCKNALGIEIAQSRPDSCILVSLGKGNDSAVLSIDACNIVHISDGFKRVTGGDKNDTFIFEGDKISGKIYGGNGEDFLDLAYFSLDISTHLLISFDSELLLVSHEFMKFMPYAISIYSIEKIVGRPGYKDSIICSCTTSFVSGNSGDVDENEFDEIVISDNSCNFNLKILLYSATVIYNQARHGQFLYHLQPNETGECQVHLDSTSTDCKHNFILPFSLLDLKNLNVDDYGINFTFAVYRKQQQFVLQIFNFTSQTFFYLNDNMKLIVTNYSILALQKTSSSIKNLMANYSNFVNKFRVSILAHSTSDNATISFGHKSSVSYEMKHFNSHIIFNDPDHVSHLVGANNENVFAITLQTSINLNKSQNLQAFNLHIPDVYIYLPKNVEFVQTVDLTQLCQQVESTYLRSVAIDIKTNVYEKQYADDLLINLHTTNDSGHFVTFGSIILKQALRDKLYDKFIIVKSHPMKINVTQWTLSHDFHVFAPSHEYISAVLVPQRLIIPSDKNILIYQEQDVLSADYIVVKKKLHSHKYYRTNKTLILTNVFQEQMEPENLMTVVFQDFFKHSQMSLVTLEFFDKRIFLGDEYNLITNAPDFKNSADFRKLYYKSQQYVTDEKWKAYKYDLKLASVYHLHSVQHNITSRAKNKSALNML